MESSGESVQTAGAPASVAVGAHAGAPADASTSTGAPAPRIRLTGTVARSLDAKSRLIIPAQQRWAFVDGVFVIPWPGPSVALIPTEEFEKIERRLRKKQRESLSDPNALLALTARATHSYPDSQGRVFIPDTARRLGRIGDDVLVVGRMRRLELWTPATFDAREDDLTAALEAQDFTEAL